LLTFPSRSRHASVVARLSWCGHRDDAAVDLKTPNSIGRAPGATVLVVPPSVGGVKDIKDYFDLFDYDIRLLSDALAKARAATN
jgi:hypothetical protein